MAKGRLFSKIVIAKASQAEFLKKLASLLDQGFSLPDAIVVLSPFYLKAEEQQNVFRLFEEGHNLSRVFEAVGYSSAIVESIRLAEMHGHLTVVLNETAQLIDKQLAMRKQAVSTLSYPIGLLAFMTVLFIGFKLYFLPLFLPLVERANPEAVGRIEFIFSLPFYMVIGTIGAGLVGWGYFFIVSQSKSLKWLMFARRALFIRALQNHMTTWQLSKDLSLLLSGGVNLPDSIRFIQSGNNLLVNLASEELLEWLERGEDFSVAVKLNRWMSKDVVRFIEHSELHGYLSEELALYQQSKAETVQKKLAFGITVAQPVLFLLIGGLVVSAYLSIMLPIYNLISI